MRIAVIGAGAVGGVIAALADRAGHQVAVTARGAQLDALQQRGLHLSGHWGEHTARPHASAALEERPDLAVLTVKAQDAHIALAENAESLRGVPLVVVQNGLGGAEAAAAQLPATAVVGGLALFAASYLSPGEVSITTPAATYLGLPAVRLDPAAQAGSADRVAPANPTAPAPGDAALRLATATLGAFMPIEVTHNFAGAQWTKLIVNQVNALPAITGHSVQNTIADPRLRAVLTDSMREAVGVARARGVHFETLLGLSDPLLRVFAAAPRPVARLLPLLMSRRVGKTPNPGSTLQSIRRGQLTEIDHLNGAVVREAYAARLEAPINARLVALVHRVEAEGAFITPTEVARAV
ncbi:2-dehydropantoate 2-reductase [Herbiconiux sp. CPCC 205763]|uniref:2-dehydropantoate 2-reductase n=1 Tax=Herbiconiux aconitum TaxID=2970913 RepID=A0ABT2GZA3_9MICO|nr:2-dehydropantoate 2-reductase [Herbiconiux aconitum]MCS5720301.1 2-dehydropantoate 2-reductase [Herbiconiux aconitum]